MIQAGNIWVNVKKMAVNGTLEIDISRPSPGSRAPWWCSSQTPARSVTKVFEGIVVSTHGGPPVDVEAGFMVTATEAGLGPVVPFGVEAERATWETLLGQVPTDVDQRGPSPQGSPPSTRGPGIVTEMLQESCESVATGNLVVAPDGTFTLIVLASMMDWDCTPAGGDVQWTLRGTAGPGELSIVGCNDPETYRGEGTGVILASTVTIEARCIDAASDSVIASFSMELSH